MSAWRPLGSAFVMQTRKSDMLCVMQQSSSGLSCFLSSIFLPLSKSLSWLCFSTRAHCSFILFQMSSGLPLLVVDPLFSPLCF